jgi:hypothetical protein
VARRESEDVSANSLCGFLGFVAQGGSGDEGSLVVADNRADKALFVRSQVTKDLSGDGSPAANGAEDGLASGVLVYSLVPDVGLLKFKGDGDDGG